MIKFYIRSPFVNSKLLKILFGVLILTLFFILIYEKLERAKNKSNLPKINLETYNDTLCPEWKNNIYTARRREFCNKTKNFPEYCICKNPFQIHFEYIPINKLNDRKNNMLLSTPIVLMTSYSSDNLMKSLTTILKTPGCIKSNIVIHIDRDNSSSYDIAKLFDIPIYYHNTSCTKLCAISQHYLVAFESTFNKFPNAKELIVIEDDLYISKDFFNFIASTVLFLRRSYKYFCISAWNDQSYKHTMEDPETLLITNTMPGLGWVMKRSIFMDQLRYSWKGRPDKIGWDVWIREPAQRKNRECIIPALSRTYHFSSEGFTVSRKFFKRHLKSRYMYNKTGTNFNLTWLINNNYDDMMIALIKNARQFTGTYSSLLALGKSTVNKIKALSNITHDYKTKKNTYKIFIETKKSIFKSIWLNIARNWGIWDENIRGFHNSAARIWLNGNQYIFIFCPFSTYCSLMSEN